VIVVKLDGDVWPFVGQGQMCCVGAAVSPAAVLLSLSFS